MKRDMQKDHPLIGDVRGVGLVLGIDLVKDRSSKERAVAEARESLLAHLTRAIEIEPDFGAALNNLGILLLLQSRYDEALRVLQENEEIVRRLAGDRHPELAKALENLGIQVEQLRHLGDRVLVDEHRAQHRLFGFD